MSNTPAPADNYVAPIAPGYVALYDQGDGTPPRRYPVVALAVQGTRAAALVLDHTGQATPAVMDDLPGRFVGVYPADTDPHPA